MRKDIGLYLLPEELSEQNEGRFPAPELDFKDLPSLESGMLKFLRWAILQLYPGQLMSSVPAWTFLEETASFYWKSSLRKFLLASLFPLLAIPKPNRNWQSIDRSVRLVLSEASLRGMSTDRFCYLLLMWLESLKDQEAAQALMGQNHRDSGTEVVLTPSSLRLMHSDFVRLVCWKYVRQILADIGKFLGLAVICVFVASFFGQEEMALRVFSALVPIYSMTVIFVAAFRGHWIGFRLVLPATVAHESPANGSAALESMPGADKQATPSRDSTSTEPHASASTSAPP